MNEFAEYDEWISKREIIQYNSKMKSELNQEAMQLILEHKFPLKLYHIMFLTGRQGAFKRLDKFYTIKYNDYEEDFYNVHKEMLQKYVVICTVLGHAICMDENGMIVRINYVKFTTEFVISSLQEFMMFLMHYGKMLDYVEDKSTGDSNVRNLSQTQIDEAKNAMKSIATESWEKYSYWIRSIEFIEKRLK